MTLPGQSGVVLAREAARRHPALRIIIASGDSRALSGEDGQALLGRVVLLPKPYDLNQMERALEQAATEATPAARTRPA